MFENVSVSAATDLVADLVLCQIIHLAEIQQLRKFKDALAHQLSWLLRSWLAYLRVLRPTLRPADPDPSTTIPVNLLTPFQGGNPGSLAQVNSNAAISYYGPTNGELRYAKLY